MRKKRPCSRPMPEPVRLTAQEAMADLYRTLPKKAAATWEADSHATELKHERLPEGVRDPWRH